MWLFNVTCENNVICENTVTFLPRTLRNAYFPGDPLGGLSHHFGELSTQKYLLKYPGAHPAIASYNATGSLARFENKNIIFYF
jgi:hypothetical protein